MRSYSDHSEVYIHSIWSTEGREPIITASIQPELYNSLAATCELLQCTAIAIGGYYDHIHILIRIPEQLPASILIAQLKQNSLPILNKHNQSSPILQWQAGYSAFNVRKQSLEFVKAYVLQQKARHEAGRLIDELEYIDPNNAPSSASQPEELHSTSVGCG